MDIENDEKYYDFCIEIIKRLHLDRNNFFKEVANLRPYESLVFSWINLHYFEGFSIDDTIDYIYKARYMLYLQETVCYYIWIKPEVHRCIELPTSIYLFFYLATF